MPSIVLALAVGLPVALILLLRSEAAIVFFSLCAGTVLLEFVGENAVLAADALIPGGNPEIATKLVLLLVPFALSIFLLRKSVPSSKLFYNLLPAVGAGLSSVLLVEPLLPFGAQKALTDGPFWTAIFSSRDLIIGATMLVSLLSLWLMHRGGHAKGHKKKH